jgi:hypothetical protein
VLGFLASAALHRWAALSGRDRIAALFDNALTGASLRNAETGLAEIVASSATDPHQLPRRS